MKAIFDRISADPLVCHVTHCIRNTCVMVWQVLDMLEADLSFSKIREELASLTDENIRSCIHYFETIRLDSRKGTPYNSSHE